MMDHFVDEEICPSLTPSLLAEEGEQDRCAAAGDERRGCLRSAPDGVWLGACRMAGKASVLGSVEADVAKSAEGQCQALCQYTWTDAGIQVV